MFSAYGSWLDCNTHDTLTFTVHIIFLAPYRIWQLPRMSDLPNEDTEAPDVGAEAVLVVQERLGRHPADGMLTTQHWTKIKWSSTTRLRLERARTFNWITWAVSSIQSRNPAYVSYLFILFWWRREVNLTSIIIENRSSSVVAWKRHRVLVNYLLLTH